MRQLRCGCVWVLVFGLHAGAVLAQEQAPEEKKEEGTTAAPSQTPEANARLDALEQAVQKLQEAETERELDSLRQGAENEAAAPQTGDRAQAPTVFQSGARSLQALNPEISLTVDAGVRASMADFSTDRLVDGSGFYLRVLGLHMEANLDPFSFLKTAVEVHPDAVELGEAYATWVAVLPGLSLTLGKFHQQLGVVNRWHAPAMDQFDRPLAFLTLVGGEPLCQTGLSLDWRMPALLADAHTLTLQVTNPMNDHLFTGEWVGIPVALLHLRNYWDLTPNSYLEFGLSGVYGTNHRRGVTVEEQVPVYDADGNPVILFDSAGNEIGPMIVTRETGPVDEAWRYTAVGALDLTLNWTPRDRERYRGLTWRTEVLFVQKETEDGTISALGGYTYLDWRLSETVVVGARFDLTQPFAAGNSGDWNWQVVPYVTWWQSAWVRFRLQVSHFQPHTGDPVDSVILQVVGSVGPHKHERY